MIEKIMIDLPISLLDPDKEFYAPQRISQRFLLLFVAIATVTIQKVINSYI